MMRLRPLRPLRVIAEYTLLTWLYLASTLRRSRRELLVWGPTPIINNKYWSAALRISGRPSTTLMRAFYPNNRREDFDRYFDELVPRWIRVRALRNLLAPYLATRWVMRHALVVHIPFTGGPLGDTRFWRYEASLLRRSAVKTIVIPYGGDVYRYSRVSDLSLRHALLRDYPLAARHESAIERRVRYWTENADVVMAGFDLDGLGRWDVTPHNMCAIDVDAWQARQADRRADGSDEKVVVAHAPNHRGFKGTEYVIRAVEQLQREGLAIELLLLERVPNEEVKKRFQVAHILLDQLITTGYGFAAIEGMASGLPVIVNLEDDRVVGLFRRYASLEECPLVSASPETVTDVLRELVRQPMLREVLGRAGREYVERYHSYFSTARVFNAIYANLFEAGTVDLLNIFNPEAGVFAVSAPIDHPLVRSQVVVNEEPC